MFRCISPKTVNDFEQYYQFRYLMLRQPWQQTKGSEQDELEDISFHRMLVDENNQIVAVARMHQTSQFSAQVRYVAVSPKHQGKGLGKQLMAEIEQLASNLGITQITLNARDNAVNFYLNLGYQNLGFSHCLYDQIDHFSMSKKINATITKANLVATQQLVTTWHNTIPMSKAMGLTISYYDQLQLITHCDPNFNKNLHHTMFAGSIYTHATLTGWGWVYLALEQQQLEGDIVLADGHIRYHAPIKSVAHARIEHTILANDFAALALGKRAKLSLTVKVYCGDTLGATFTGLYVILPSDNKKGS